MVPWKKPTFSIFTQPESFCARLGLCLILHEILKKMLDFPTNSDDQSKSSMSISDTNTSHCTGFSRLSFELPANSPVQLKPRRSSDSSFQAIRSKTRLTFQDFSLVHQIDSGDIGRVYLWRLRGAVEERLYAMKVVDNEVLVVYGCDRLRRAGFWVEELEVLGLEKVEFGQKSEDIGHKSAEERRRPVPPLGGMRELHHQAFSKLMAF